MDPYNRADYNHNIDVYTGGAEGWVTRFRGSRARTLCPAAYTRAVIESQLCNLMIINLAKLYVETASFHVSVHLMLGIYSVCIHSAVLFRYGKLQEMPRNNIFGCVKLRLKTRLFIHSSHIPQISTWGS